MFAHGYVAFNAPLDFYNLILADGTDCRCYPAAWDSLRHDELPAERPGHLEGVADLGELIDRFGEIIPRSASTSPACRKAG